MRKANARAELARLNCNVIRGRSAVKHLDLVCLVGFGMEENRKINHSERKKKEVQAERIK